MLHSLLRTYHRVSDKSNTTGATRGAGIDYPSGASKFSFGFNEVRVVRSLVFGVICFISLFFHFFLFFLPLDGLFLELRLLITLSVVVNHCISRFFCSLHSLHFFDLRLLVTFLIFLIFSCKSLHVLFLLVIVLSDLPRLTASYYLP
jgi:hypothetical protein